MSIIYRPTVRPLIEYGSTVRCTCSKNVLLLQKKAFKTLHYSFTTGTSKRNVTTNRLSGVLKVPAQFLPIWFCDCFSPGHSVISVDWSWSSTTPSCMYHGHLEQIATRGGNSLQPKWVQKKCEIPASELRDCSTKFTRWETHYHCQKS